MYEKEMRKIVPIFNKDGYMALKPNGNCYYRKGRFLRGLRELLNYVQGVRCECEFDFSEIDDRLRVKLEDIVSGKKTVIDKDWRAKV